MSQKKVLIFGSCVSRDPFSADVSLVNGFDLKDYFARSSLASMSGRPLEVQDLSNIPSPFQRKMVARDFSKDFNRTNFNNIDIIIIDFIDDRFALLVLDGDVCCTESVEFIKSGLNLNAKKISPFSDEFYSYWESGWLILLKKLVNLGCLKKLIVNNVYLAIRDDADKPFENIHYIRKMNAWLRRIYFRLAMDIPEEQFVNYGEIEFIAKSDHKWGRSPFHYNILIERFFMQKLNDEFARKNNINIMHLSYIGIVRGDSYEILISSTHAEYDEAFMDLSNLTIYCDNESREFAKSHDYSIFSSLTYNFKGSRILRISVKISPQNICTSLVIRINDANIPCGDKRFALDILEYNNFEKFQASFSFANDRITDEETVRHIARNNLLNTAITTGSIKVTSFSIYLYKSFSLNAVNNKEIEALYTIALESIHIFSEEEKSSRSIRTNPESRALSVVVAYCHYLLYANKFQSMYEEFCRVLQIYSDLLTASKNKSSLDDNSYLYIRLLIFSWVSLNLLETSPKDKIKDLQERIIGCYSQAAKKSANMPRAYLKEFGETYLIYYKFRAIIDSDKISINDFATLIKESIRVKSSSFNELIEKNLLSHAKTIFSLNNKTLSKRPEWLPCTLKDSNYLIKIKFSSKINNNKAAIICFKPSFKKKLDNSTVSGLRLSSNTELGYYKYLATNVGNGGIEFYVSIENIELNHIAFFLWADQSAILVFEDIAIYDLKYNKVDC